MNTYYKIASHRNELTFGLNKIAIATINDKTICVGALNNKLFAFAHKCPHAGALLSEGYIDSIGNVVCPLHGYKYNLTNGINVTGEGYYLKHWEVEEREDGVWVSMG